MAREEVRKKTGTSEEFFQERFVAPRARIEALIKTTAENADPSAQMRLPAQQLDNLSVGRKTIWQQPSLANPWERGRTRKKQY
jgi:hypothetical protein